MTLSTNEKNNLSTAFKQSQAESPGQIYDFLVDYGWELIRRLGVDSCDDVIRLFEDFYQKVIRPIDLPGIPNFIEPAADTALMESVSALLKQACKLIDFDKHMKELPDHFSPFSDKNSE